MEKILLPMIFVAILAISGCSSPLSYVTNKNIETKPLVSEQTNNPIENKTVKTTSGVTINLSGQGLTKAPMSIFSQTNTEILDLSNNQLTGALPSQIGNLKKLKVLIASNNLMTGVPAEVGQLSNLELLDLSNNQLTGLPNELGNLKNLKTMNLAGNNYSQQDLDYIKQRLPNTNFILK
jgi:Leucine-rich repeat (LRR) protein